MEIRIALFGVSFLYVLTPKRGGKFRGRVIVRRTTRATLFLRHSRFELGLACCLGFGAGGEFASKLWVFGFRGSGIYAFRRLLGGDNCHA